MNELELSDDVLELHQKLDDAESKTHALEQKLSEAYAALEHQNNVVAALSKLALRIQ
jgi:hypothetical protein